jgi:hypothetical protein
MIGTCVTHVIQNNKLSRMTLKVLTNEKRGGLKVVTFNNTTVNPPLFSLAYTFKRNSQSQIFRKI